MRRELRLALMVISVTGLKPGAAGWDLGVAVFGPQAGSALQARGDPGRPRHLITEPGIGYRFEA